MVESLFGISWLRQFFLSMGFFLRLFVGTEGYFQDFRVQKFIGGFYDETVVMLLMVVGGQVFNWFGGVGFLGMDESVGFFVYRQIVYIFVDGFWRFRFFKFMCFRKFVFFELRVFAVGDYVFRKLGREVREEFGLSWIWKDRRAQMVGEGWGGSARVWLGGSVVWSFRI